MAENGGTFGTAGPFDSGPVRWQDEQERSAISRPLPASGGGGGPWAPAGPTESMAPNMANSNLCVEVRIAGSVSAYGSAHYDTGARPRLVRDQVDRIVQRNRSGLLRGPWRCIARLRRRQAVGKLRQAVLRLEQPQPLQRTQDETGAHVLALDDEG